MKRWMTALIVAGLRRTPRAGSGLRRWRLIGAAAVLPLGVLGLTLASAPSALADTGHCLVINSATNTTSKTLQAAVDAASPRATLWVRGTCTGTATISKDLTITGQQPAGYPAPTLNGGGAGSVLSAFGRHAVTLNNLVITGGGNTSQGGGIDDAPTVTLTVNDSTITGNTATDPQGGAGGGIWNENGSVTLNDSTVTGNTATGVGADGGGIWNQGTATLNNSTVTGNTPDNCAPAGRVPNCTN